MNPFKLFKRFSLQSPYACDVDTDFSFVKSVSLKTYERIAHIFSNHLLTRDFIYSCGDGLDILLKAGLKPLLKEALDLCLKEGKAYILLHFDDTACELNQKVEEFSRWELGCVTPYVSSATHPTRYLALKDYKSLEEREALKSICALFDEAIFLLKEGLEFSLKPYLQLGDLNSLLETRSYTVSEQEELKKLLTRLAHPKSHILGRDDKLGTISASASVVEIFKHLATQLSFHSCLPLSYFLPQEKLDGQAYQLFLQELEALSQFLLKPLIDQLLKRLHLSSNWQFRELAGFASKEKIESEFKKAQTASLWLESLKTCMGHTSQEIEELIYQKTLNFLNFH